jgi:nucleoside-diphosphate-sugar epimerase
VENQKQTEYSVMRYGVNSTGFITVDDVVRAMRVTLEPGDLTQYNVIVTQTARQLMVDELSVALIIGRGGAAMDVAGWMMLKAWREIRDLDMEAQLSHHQVQWVNDALGAVKNIWTARAVVEAVGRVADWWGTDGGNDERDN